MVAVLATPAAAGAATFTVAAGGGACGGADTDCGTIAAAAGAAGAGDTVQIAPGAYTESADFAAGNLTVTGSTEAPGVVVTGTLTFSGGARSVLQKLIVAAPAGGGPAVVAGGAGAAVRDAVLLSADGPGMSIAGGSTNELIRSSVLSAAAGATGLDIALGSADAGLTIDSSIISGGASGIGLRVRTGVGTLLSAGSASITARHVTIAGAGTAISLDSSATTGLLSDDGNIAMTAADSIIQGATPTKSNAGLIGPLLPPNTATLTLTRTDRTTAADALFVSPAKRNYHLRADAPVIDKGQLTAGESATDVDGQPRTAGEASDLGADEFGNTAPTAAIAVKTPTPRASIPVTFDGSGSVDREAGLGGGIAEYRWTFGDGSTATTAVPTVDHIYPRAGAVVAQLVVVDRQGATSEPATTPVKLESGGAPTVVITKPKHRATIALLAKQRKGARKRRARATIAFAGTAQAAGGVKRVILTIQKVGTKKTCTWLDKVNGLVKAPCAQPVLINAKLRSGKWTYAVARDQARQGPLSHERLRDRQRRHARQRSAAEAPHRAVHAEVAHRRGSDRSRAVPRGEPRELGRRGRRLGHAPRDHAGARRARLALDGRRDRPPARPSRARARRRPRRHRLSRRRADRARRHADQLRHRRGDGRPGARPRRRAGHRERRVSDDRRRVDRPADGDLDGVLVRWGYMLLADPGHRAARDAPRAAPRRSPRARRLGRPRGQPLGLGARSQLAAMGAIQPPDPDAPDMFAFRDPERIVGLLEETGFEDIVVEQVAIVYRYPSLDDWWDTLLDISTTLARAVGALTPAQRDDLRDAVDARLAQYVADDGSVALPGLTHVAAAGA